MRDLEKTVDGKFPILIFADFWLKIVLFGISFGPIIRKNKKNGNFPSTFFLNHSDTLSSKIPRLYLQKQKNLRALKVLEMQGFYKCTSLFLMNNAYIFSSGLL